MSIQSPRLSRTNEQIKYNNDPTECLKWQYAGVQIQEETTITCLDEPYAVSLAGTTSTVNFAEWDVTNQCNVLQPGEQAVTESIMTNDIYSLLGDWHNHEDIEPTISVSGINLYYTEMQLKLESRVLSTRRLPLAESTQSMPPNGGTMRSPALTSQSIR